MEVCYQLPVLPLDRPVPQHVLSRRGAISFSSSSALFGCPNPRQLSQVGTATGPAGSRLSAPHRSRCPGFRGQRGAGGAGAVRRGWDGTGWRRGCPRGRPEGCGGGRRRQGRAACLPGRAAGRALPACCPVPVTRRRSVLWVYG